jgi:predicted DNA-binding protein (MmcQ/YjbR family)
MTYDEVMAVCLSFPGAWEDMPWEDDVVVKAGPKVFAFPGGEGVTLKVDPETGDSLRATYPAAISSPPYLSKRHWVRIALDGTVPDDELRELLADSYRLVVKGLTRAQRSELDG